MAVPCNDARRGAIGAALAVASLIGPISGAAAHGIAGDRLFPSTLTVEDVLNADELIIPTVSRFKHPTRDRDPAATDTDLLLEYSQRLTEDLSVLVGDGWRWRTPARGATRGGLGDLHLGLKYLTLRDDAREFLVSTLLSYSIGGTGSASLRAPAACTVSPGFTVGKGFGDLPATPPWNPLRPLALSGAAAFDLPVGAGATTARFGVALQYSLLFYDQHVAPRGLTPAL